MMYQGFLIKKQLIILFTPLFPEHILHNLQLGKVINGAMADI